MKRIGILSDTHSCWDDRYARHFADCDEIWHAGDVGDYSIIERLREVVPTVRAVSGNIDNGEVRRLCPEVQQFDCEGVKVWLTHIAGYPGRYAPGVKRLLRDEGVNLMVCGQSDARSGAQSASHQSRSRRTSWLAKGTHTHQD